MRTFTVSTVVTEYESGSELPAPLRELLDAARATAQNAYAPYSNFKVGAAVRLENGTIVTGSNQENAAYPSGLCAERVAVFSAGANFPGVAAEAIAVCCVAENKTGKPFSPCGACRQVLSEYENRGGKPIRILLGGMKGPVHVVDSADALLPIAFRAEQLKK